MPQTKVLDDFTKKKSFNFLIKTNYKSPTTTTKYKRFHVFYRYSSMLVLHLF